MLRQTRSIIGMLTLVGLSLIGTVAAQGFDYQFNVDGVLPSAQLANYCGSYAESSAFSVSGGRLHQNTLPATSDVGGCYELSNSFDHNLPARLEWGARLIACDGACQASAAVSVIGGGYHWVISLAPEGQPFQGDT
jgi:hypothetical protein